MRDDGVDNCNALADGDVIEENGVDDGGFPTNDTPRSYNGPADVGLFVDFGVGPDLC